MKLKARVYVSYDDEGKTLFEWVEIELPTEPFSSIDNCWQWIRRIWPNAQIRIEWTYVE